MNVFISGATGVIGKRVIPLLLANGHRVVGLARSKDNAQELTKMGAEYAEADLFSPDEIIEACTGCDSIIHLATSIPQKLMPKRKDWNLNDRIRVEGTRNLISAAKHNDIKKFIGQSVTALYGQQNGRFVTDQTPLPQKQLGVLESAAAMEKMIEEGLDGGHVIFRFGTFYSKDAYHTQNMLSSIKAGKLPLIGKGDFYGNYIHTDDAASCIAFGLENFEKLKGKTLNVSDFKPVSSEELIRNGQSILKGKRPLKLPHWLAKLALGSDLYGFITNSYRIERPNELESLQISKPSFISEIKNLID